MKKNVHLISHPVLTHKLTMLRDKSTTPWDFRRIMNEISPLLAYEATKDLELIETPLTTPMEKTTGQFVAAPLIAVSIMRAGNGMLDGVLSTLPFCEVGHIGIYRDKFINNTVEYYFKLPKETEGKQILLVDPMVATADTCLAAINRLKEYKVGPIRFICLLISPVAIEKLTKEHPDVQIFTLSIERELTEDGYLLPGLGDAGDRLYSTL